MITLQKNCYLYKIIFRPKYSRSWSIELYSLQNNYQGFLNVGFILRVKRWTKYSCIAAEVESLCE